MNKTAFLPLALLGLAPTVGAAPVPKAAYSLKLDDYNINTVDYSFPSGLRVLFQEDHTQPIVSVTNWFDRGSVYDGVNSDGETTEGIAHAVEHLAFRAKHGDLPKNWDVINQLGGILNASTSREWTNYMTVAPVDAAIPLLRIEALRMEDGVAGVTEEDIEAEKAIVRNELRMGYESGANGSAAARTAFKHMPKLLFPKGHIYQNSTIGDHETIKNIDLDSVQRYVRENYRPEFATIAMVGDFKLDEGQGFNMILDAFKGVEHLLMAADDADKYKGLTDEVERSQFFADWFDNNLVPHMQEVAGKPAEPRVDCSNKVEPPMELASDEILKIQGMVDSTTVIAAWALPSGYCADDVNMNIAASQLQNYIGYTLDPSYSPLSQESEIDGLACFVDADKRGSILMCFVEQGALSKDSPEKLLDKVGDALYLQTKPEDPIFAPFYRQNMQYSRLYALSSVLSQTDNIASLYGRSFFVSQHAHYTGSPRFFSDTMTGYNTMSFEDAKAIAGKYITRDRMARMIIEPMDEEERERLEAGASEADKDNSVGSEHRAADDHSRQLFDPSMLTPAVIKGVTVVPDLEKMDIFTLDNGLEVVIMNHGEAPLVKIGLQVRGDNQTAPAYMLDTFAEGMFRSAVTSNGSPAENPLAIAGNVGRSRTGIFASGSSGNLDALMHKMRWHLEDYDWLIARKGQRIRSWRGSAKGGKKPEGWAERVRYQRLYPNHIYGRSMVPADVDVAANWNLTDVKDWMQAKWQPANARLVVVGKVDPKEARALAEEFFGGWEYQGTGEAGAVAPPPKTTEQPDRQVLLFDKPISTQSKVQLTCQLGMDSRDDRPVQQVMGELMSFLAFERLREEKGLTYGAYAFPRARWGNNAELIIASVIQNSGVSIGVQTMFDLVDEGATGKYDDSLIKTNTWNVARTSVTGLQSGDQMLSALLGPERDNMEYYDRYPDLLSTVNAEKMGKALEPCLGHEVVTVVGPVEQITPQLDEAGIAYEVVDWEKLYEGNLSAKELKKYQKAKAKSEAKKAKDDAKKAAEGDGSADGEATAEG